MRNPPPWAQSLRSRRGDNIAQSFHRRMWRTRIAHRTHAALVEMPRIGRTHLPLLAKLRIDPDVAQKRPDVLRVEARQATDVRRSRLEGAVYYRFHLRVAVDSRQNSLDRAAPSCRCATWPPSQK